ncbi:hypothetical protein J4Q44_G00029250 [Coregonus suidteri]|uniref:Uncharacterized protein n=1 Tax=Coregonus suidteri TaxID=861788 RepID=A0AAN8MMU7_9TELE
MAWATVGIDISPDELVAYLRAQADEKTPRLLYYVELPVPIPIVSDAGLSWLLLATMLTEMEGVVRGRLPV